MSRIGNRPVALPAGVEVTEMCIRDRTRIHVGKENFYQGRSDFKHFGHYCKAAGGEMCIRDSLAGRIFLICL